MVDWFYKTVTEQGMICPNERVVVGLSGGADSVCLLYLCHKIREKIPYSLSAAHVNHGLRPEADEEAAFCKELCKKWNIPFFETKGCARKPGKNTEAEGRAMRYSFFQSLHQDKIALAHHKNDQAETVLLHLLRGCGTEGLGGMAPIRGQYIRPLLQKSRKEIEAFCQQEGLSYCTDQSNFNTDYTRNRIRLEVIPLLEQINPEVVNALCRTASITREDALQLQQDTKKAFCFSPMEDGFFCSREEFFGHSPSMQKRMIRKCWEMLTGEQTDLWLEPLEEAIRLFSAGKTGKKVLLGKNIWAENSYEQLLIAKETPPLTFCISLKEGERVLIPGTDRWITAYRGTPKPDADFVFYHLPKSSEIIVRSRRDGDVFCLNGQIQKLKKLFIDRKIPVRDRDRALIVEYEGTIIGVTGLGVAKEYRGNGEDCLIVTQERMEQK